MKLKTLMQKKTSKIVASTLAAVMAISITAPLSSAHASENENLVQTVQPISVVHENPTSVTYLDSATQNEDIIIQPYGAKVDGAIAALKGASWVVGEVIEIFSKKNAKIFLDNRKNMIKKLETWKNDHEKRLLDYLIFDLGLPQSGSRIIVYLLF